jgi:hypothetical protein
MKKTLAALIANPLTYVIGFAVAGAAGVVSGVAILAGSGWALIAAGSFAISFSAFITKGMSPNG